MSKDKGEKNVKKAPANRVAGKPKASNAYKSEYIGDLVIVLAKSSIENHGKSAK